MSWTEDAICIGADTDRIFFPIAKHGREIDYREAARYCAICPVVSECLDDALRAERMAGSRHGFRGGMTPDQRAQLVVQR